ncbi:hypothetical protein ACQJ9Y_07960, partial [Helicobacter pylori]
MKTSCANYLFLNSIEKQLLKAEGDKNKAIKKIQECELQEQMIRQVLAQKHFYHLCLKNAQNENIKEFFRHALLDA